MSQTKKAPFFRVVVVGGGFGGVKTALQLARDARCRVTLVSDRDNLVYYPLMYETATGATRKISAIPLSDIFQHSQVSVVQDTVVGLDTTRKLVVGKSKQVEYDAVVFALGVVTNYFGIEGLEQFSLGIKSPEAVRTFRRHLHDELLQTQHFDKHYVVVGAGPTGVELSASLKDYLMRVGKRHGVKAHRVNISLIEAAPRVLPRFSEQGSQRVERRLRSLGVHLLLGTAVKKQDADTLVAGDRELATETVVWTSGVSNHPFYATHSPTFRTTETGKVAVNEHMEAAPDVFVIGDNAATKYAGLAQTALHDAKFVARVIRARLDHSSLPVYVPSLPFSVVPVGHRWAALERGPLRLYGFPASLLRKIADLKGYGDILPLRHAIRLWLSERETEEFECELCQKNNDASRVAPLE